MSRKYISLSPEQIRDAQHADIAEYLLKRGEPLRRKGKTVIWDVHDSCTITGFKWYQNSTGKHGAAGSCVQNFFGLSFPDAGLALTGGHVYSSTPNSDLPPNPDEPVSKQSSVPPLFFLLPPAAENHRRLFAYLNQSRKISPDIITEFLIDKLIYQDTNGNIVFVCYDHEGIARAAHLRGTYSQKRFRKFVEGGNFCIGFNYTPVTPATRLYVFEAAIDLMSFISMHRHEPWHRYAYLSLGGLSGIPLQYFLRTNRNIREICFCLDNDADKPENPGQAAVAKFLSKYKNRYTVSSLIPYLGKDWNEELVQKEVSESCQRP